jgi:integrase
MESGKNVENLQTYSEAPTPQNVTVRSPRPRDYLTEREVEKLMDAARTNRWGHRDATAILLAYRHGLRASELVALRWDDTTYRPASFMCAAPRAGKPVSIPSGQRSFVPYVACSGKRGNGRSTYSYPNVSPR